MIAIQETESETVQNRPHNFEEFYQEWLSAPWIGHPGQINADRDPTALSNHRRALKVLSLSSGFTGILNETPISAINLSAELIGVRLATWSVLHEG